jgi:anti-sigma B factor antagonist
LTAFQLSLTEPSEGVLMFELTGELDLSTADPVKQAVKDALASRAYSTLVFDVSRLGFIDSTGLHLMAQAHRAMLAAGGQTRVICGPGNVRKVFELTGLDRTFAIVSDPGDAFAVTA